MKIYVSLVKVFVIGYKVYEGKIEKKFRELKGVAKLISFSISAFIFLFTTLLNFGDVSYITGVIVSFLLGEKFFYSLFAIPLIAILDLMSIYPFLWGIAGGQILYSLFLFRKAYITEDGVVFTIRE